MSERINELYTQIVDEINLYDDYVSANLQNYSIVYCEYAKMSSKEMQCAMVQALHQLIDKSKKYVSIWLYSCCVGISYENEIYEEFLQYIIECKNISANTRYFIYYQLVTMMFRNVHLETTNAKLRRWKLLEEIVQEFRVQFKDMLIPIPLKDRNNKFAVVVVEQMLDVQHGPTKIALDRSKALMQNMGKNVLLINTAELLSQRGYIPFYNVFSGNYKEELTTQESIEWKGAIIPFFQCDNNMPNVLDLRSLLQMVLQMKPEIVVGVGGSGILVNLINDVIPVLMVGTNPSDLAPTMVRCQTLSRKLTKEDRELLAKMNIEENRIIESVFTSSLQVQTRKVSREVMGLPNDKFVIAVVGYRLDADIDKKFIDVLEKLIQSDVCVAFIGKYSPYEKLISEKPEFKGGLKVLGLTDDILSWIENCDLYINPYRKGGGTSAVEALVKGIPVITLPYGDVAVNVGEEFWCVSYEHMIDLVRIYKNDKKFYAEMSEKAVKRAEILLDTDKEFIRIVDEFMKKCNEGE